MEIVGQASDGLGAIQKAREVQPDLIFLDIGLPKLNGIEASRRIREGSPTSRIVFVSQNCDPEVVEHALSAGGLGYVLKTDARVDLLPALEAVLRGERFVSRRLADVRGLWP